MKQAVAFRPRGQDTIVDREVDNPDLTDGLYFSESRSRHAKVTVRTRELSRIGALCYVPAPDREYLRRTDGYIQPGRRYPHHEYTAERFKTSMELLGGGGVQASDNCRPFVDRSLGSYDGKVVGLIDRAAELSAILYGIPATEFSDAVPPVLTPDQQANLIDWIYYEIPIHSFGDLPVVSIMPSGQRNQRQANERKRKEFEYVVDRLSIIDQLSEFYGYSSKKGRAA